VLRFDRYILSQLTVLFGFFSLVLVSVYWINRAVGLFDQLIGDGQSALVFLQFTALALPNVIRLVLPISAFAATVYVMNRLTSESELVVAQAMGFSTFRLARPVLVFGLMVAALVSALNHVLVPASRTELSVRSAEISEDLAAQLLVEGKFVHPARNITLFIGEIAPNGELVNVLLSDSSQPGQRVTYTAERALLVKGAEGPNLVMFDGMAQVLYLDDKRLAVTRFRDSVYDVGQLVSPSNRRARGLEELSTLELIRATPDGPVRGNPTRAEFLYEGHARISQPFLAVAGSLIGLAALLLGGFSRFGVWRQVLFACALLILLQLMDNAMADVARSDARLWPSVYLTPLVGIAVGFTLLWIAARPDLFRRRRRGGGGT